MEAKIKTSILFKMILLLNIVLGIPFWFVVLTDYTWKNITFSWIFSGFVGVIGFLSFLFSCRLKLPTSQKQFGVLFIFYMFISGFAVGAMEYYGRIDEPNPSCEKLYRDVELSSPDKSKQLVVCDFIGPSGIKNVQIHYLLFPLIRRDLVFEQDRLFSNLYVGNYYSSHWVTNDTLFTQDPDNLKENKMMFLNVWYPRVDFLSCIAAFVIFVLSLSCYFVSEHLFLGMQNGYSPPS
jgi:hypothetical protein